MLCVFQNQYKLINAVDLIFDALDERPERVGNVINESVGDPVGRDADIILELLNSPPDILRMRSWPKVELPFRLVTGEEVRLRTSYRKNTVTEDNDIHVERLEVCGTVWVLVETAETDEVIITEEFNLLARFLHLDILCSERVNGEDLHSVSHESKGCTID